MDTQAHMELVQDSQVQEARHAQKVKASDEAAKSALAAYKARQGQPAKQYGTAVWWVGAVAVAILALVVRGVVA